MSDTQNILSSKSVHIYIHFPVWLKSNCPSQIQSLSLSSVSWSSSTFAEFEQDDPRQCHMLVNTKLFLCQEHLAELQSVAQLQRMILSSSSGAG